MTTQPEKPTNECIVCGKAVKTLRRGLCPSHYAQYSRARENAIAKGLDADEYDASLVQQGLLAEDYRNTNNPFAIALQQFAANQKVARLEKATKDARKKSE